MGSVYALQAELDAAQIRTKSRIGKDGTEKGNAAFSRGCLYQMLRNPLYIGHVAHKGNLYSGNHEPIIDAVMFETVGKLLDANRVDNRNAVHAEHPSLLTGLVWDGEGRRMTGNHANKQGVRYRYYVSLKDKSRLELPVWRVPAGDLETLVILHTSRHISSEWVAPVEAASNEGTRAEIVGAIAKIIVRPDAIEIHFTDTATVGNLIVIAAKLVRISGEKRINVLASSDRPVRRDPALIKLVIKGWQARRHFETSRESSLKARAHEFGASQQYYAVLLRLGYLAPDIVGAILDGRQPNALNRERLARISALPHDWAEQRSLLGFDQA